MAMQSCWHWRFVILILMITISINHSYHPSVDLSTPLIPALLHPTQPPEHMLAKYIADGFKLNAPLCRNFTFVPAKYFDFFLVTTPCTCSALGFRHKNHMVRVRKTPWFWLKICGLVRFVSQLEKARLPSEKIASFWQATNSESKYPRGWLKMWWAGCRKLANKQVMWIWNGTFGAIITVGRICGLETRYC